MLDLNLGSGAGALGNIEGIICCIILNFAFDVEQNLDGPVVNTLTGHY